MTVPIDYERIALLLRESQGCPRPDDWDRRGGEGAACLAAAKLCEREALIEGLMEAVGELPATGGVYPEQHDEDMPVRVHVLVAISDAAKRVREAT